MFARCSLRLGGLQDVWRRVALLERAAMPEAAESDTILSRSISTLSRKLICKQNLILDSVVQDKAARSAAFTSIPAFRREESESVLASVLGGQARKYSSVAPSSTKTRALLIANSTLYGGSYMGHCGETIQRFLKKGDAREVLFVPYALKDYEKYFGEFNLYVSSVLESFIMSDGKHAR
jgi:hypothetical protein